MAFVLGIRYLTGYSVAAMRPGGEPEWPPHPARVFMALAAAYFETGRDPKERDALEWLESLEEQPAMYASEADIRTAVTHFVPVNDKSVGKKPGLLQSVSGWPRSKQARTYPRVRPHDDRVFLVWNFHCPAEHRRALQSVCIKVTRLGHSSSLAQMWVAETDEIPPPSWVPEEIAALRSLRKITPGLLARLEADCNREAIEMYADFEQRMKLAKGKEKMKGPIMAVTVARFDDFIRQVYGYSPFPWQQMLVEKIAERIKIPSPSDEQLWPRGIDLPTASGKTACLDIAVYTLALSVETGSETIAPRRVFFVVDRRIVVDEAYSRARKLAQALADARKGIVAEVATRLRELAGSDAPLAACRMRGGVRREDEWIDNPAQPAIITSTVDQVGSRLLFRGVWPGKVDAVDSRGADRL